MPDGILNRIWWKTCTIEFCIQKLVKQRQGEADLTPADFFLWGLLKGKNTPRTIEQLRHYTPRDTSRQRRHFGKSIPEFGETHSSVLGCERRPVSALIMSRSCFASFPVCVYKFSSHYLNNIIFIYNSLGPLARDSPCIPSMYAFQNRLTILNSHFIHQK